MVHQGGGLLSDTQVGSCRAHADTVCIEVARGVACNDDVKSAHRVQGRTAAWMHLVAKGSLRHANRPAASCGRDACWQTAMRGHAAHGGDR